MKSSKHRDSYESIPLIYIQRDVNSQNTSQTLTETSINKSNEWLSKTLKHRYAFENNVEGIKQLQVISKRYEEWLDEETEGLSIFPLHCAAIGHSISSIEALTTADTDEKTKEKREEIKYSHMRCGIQPLHVAALYSSWKTKTDIKETDEMKIDTERLINALHKIHTDQASLNGTPLHFACMQNNYNLAVCLVNSKINDINECNIDNISPLHIACEYNAPDIVTLLLNNNADVFAVDVNGNTVFHYAIRCGNVEIVKILVEHIAMMSYSSPTQKPTSSTGSSSYQSAHSIDYNTLQNILCQNNIEISNLLQCAVEHGNEEITNYFLEKLTLYNHHKNPYLVHIAAMKGYAAIIQSLYEHDYDIEFRDKKGRTAFHIAALHNQREVILILLAIEANHEANDDLGYTPLLCAASRDSIEVFKILWEYSCKTKVSLFGNSVVMVSIKNNSIKCLKYMIYKDKKDEIMSKMFMLPNLRLNTPLHVVAETGNIKVFKMIQDYYTNISMRNIDLQSPLHLSALMGHVDLVKGLLNKNIDSINLQDKRGNTPLILAIRADSREIINLLFKHGALYLQLNKNINPLNIAIIEGKIEAVKALFKNPLIVPLYQGDFYPLHYAIEYKQIFVFKMLMILEIEKVIIIVNKVKNIDGTKMTCLDLALKLKYEEGVKVIFETLDVIDPGLWKRLMYRRESHNDEYSPIQMMILYMPNMLEYFFNKCISDHNNGMKEYNYEILEDIYYMPNDRDLENSLGISPYICQKNGNGKLRPEAKQHKEKFVSIIQTHPLMLMYQRKLFDLFEHELVASYLKHKWNHCTRWLYYSVGIFNFLLVILLSYCTYKAKSLFNNNTTEDIIETELIITTNNSSINSIKEVGLCMDSWSFWLITMCVFIMTVFNINWCYKIHRVAKILDLLICIPFISIILCTNKLLECDQATKINWLIIFNILAWIILFKYVRKFPRFGVYVLIIWKSIKTFIRMLPLFILFVIPFSTNFYLLLNIPEISDNVLKSALHSIVFLTSEFDYAGTIGQSHYILLYVIFFIYLFIGSVFLMNLLTGLAVSDTSVAIIEATETRIYLELELIFHVEACLPEYIRRKIARSCEVIWIMEADFYSNFGSFLCNQIKKILKNFGLPKDILQKEKSEQENIEKILFDNNESNQKLEENLDKIVGLIEEKLDKSIDRMLEKKLNTSKVTVKRATSNFTNKKRKRTYILSRYL